MKSFFLLPLFAFVLFGAFRSETSLWQWLFSQDDFQEQESPPRQDATVLNEDTPWSPERYEFLTRYSQEREFRPPNYENQKALGYDTQSFATPRGLEKQVEFWLSIYTKYSTLQGVIHDTENLDLIYAVLDFNEIQNRTDINKYRKEHLKEKLVDDEKKRISQLLTKMSRQKQFKPASSEEQRVFDLVKNHPSNLKFSDLSEGGRVRFQLGQKDRMSEAIFLSGRYMEDIEKIFQEEGLPKELARIAFVESSFNVLARSKVGASGIWQIMPTSVRKSAIQPSHDLRNHPLEATKAAAKLLKFNYRVLEKWPLAVTAYNHGPTGLKKTVKKYQNSDLGYLIKNVRSRKSFGFASKNFYACFLAVLEVEKNASKYFPGIKWSTLLDAKSVRLTQGLRYKKLLELFQNDTQKLQLFNPHLTSATRKNNLEIPRSIEVFIPSNKDLNFPQIRSATKN
jgi:membrane-bound lytic murein transglycosylase D